MNRNDNHGIKTLKSGDQKSIFHWFYQASYTSRYHLFCSSYVSLEEAEEIVQGFDDVCVVGEKRELLVEDLSLKSFLFTSVRNRALNSITRSILPSGIYEEYPEP